MAAPVIYRSSDTNAPILNGCAGSALNMLTQCLVNGYGSTRATATITSSGVNVSDGDTVTVDGTTYTFKTALGGVAGQVLIGGSAAASLSNLCAAMHGWGTSATTYVAGTAQQTRVQTTALTTTVITLTAFTGGTGGNSLALAKSAVTLTVSGAAFTGGSGTDTTASLGWGSPFTGTNKAVFRAATGARHYLDVDDSSPNTTANGRNFVVRGYEIMTAVATGTNLFPTTVQVTTAVGGVKSTSSDQVARPWIIVGDGLTFYLFNEPGGTDPPNLGSHSWTDGFFFGEILSVLTGDLYRTTIGYHGQTATAATATLLAYGQASISSGATSVPQFMPRTSTGVGGAVWVQPVVGQFLSTGGVSVFEGLMPTFPNPIDGGLYMNAIDIFERGVAGTPAAATSSRGARGRWRGVLSAIYSGGAIFNDQDTFTGVGDFAGRTFIIFKVTSGQAIIETTAWTASS